MGITTWGNPDQYGLSLTLGAAEVKMVDLSTVYGTIANQGQIVNFGSNSKSYQLSGRYFIQKTAGASGTSR